MKRIAVITGAGLLVLLGSLVEAGQLVLDSPQTVNTLEVAWIKVTYPTEVRLKWSRHSFTGKRDWPRVDVRVESSSGQVVVTGVKSLLDPRNLFGGYSCSVGVVPRQIGPHDIFPLQVFTGALSPDNYKCTVSVTLTPSYSLNTEDARLEPMTLKGSFALTVISATEEAEGKIQQVIKATEPTLAFQQLAPLVLSGSPDLVQFVIGHAAGNDSAALAQMWHLNLMRKEDAAAVTTVVQVIRGQQRRNDAFERAATYTLSQKAGRHDLSLLDDAIAGASDRGKKVALVAAARVAGLDDPRWSPSPDYFTSQIPDLNAFRDQVKRAAE